MHISKQNRQIVYECLFKEGVLVATKDTVISKHLYLEKVPNLQVMLLMRSMKTRGFVTETFSWGHFYWVLTDTGIAYLRNFLNLPINCIPNPLKKPEQTIKPEGGDKNYKEGYGNKAIQTQ